MDCQAMKKPSGQHLGQHSADFDRALALLAGNPDGMTESLLVYAHEIPIEVLVKLIHAGLAVASVEQLGRPRIEVVTVRITDAGRRAVEWWRGGENGGGRLVELQ